MSTNPVSQIQPISAPPVAAETLTQAPAPSLERVNLMMSRLSLDVLDTQSAKMLKETGARINRSQIVRAMIEAFGESNLEFRGVQTEADMKTILLRYFGQIGQMIRRARAEAQRKPLAEAAKR